MEPNPEELLSALKDAKEFICVSLPKESLSRDTENKRQQLETKLKNLINRSSGKENSPLPPRPPKSSPNVPEEENDGEDLYDDVGPDSIEVKDEGPNDHPISPAVFSMGIEGVSKESQDNITQENYEDMSNKDLNHEEDTYDDTVNVNSKEDSTSITEDVDYEIADPGKAAASVPEEDDGLYDGVDSQDVQDEIESTKADSSSEQQKRSTIHELGMLTNPVKVADVRGVIYKGFIDKHRKKGKIYIGGKWQKRYCVVRNFVLYYFVNQNSERQKGTIILPGYKVSVNKSKTNREFILTRDQDRSYIFQAESKEEMEKWMNAIQKASNAKISNRQSQILENLRSQFPDADEDANSIQNGSFEGGGDQETYDDVQENEDSGSAVVDYEIPQAEPSSKPKDEAKTEESAGLVKEKEAVQDDIYEMPEDENNEPSAPAQPPRPSKIGQVAAPMPAPPITPTPVEDEDFYDDVGVDIPETEVAALPPGKPHIPERNIPLPATPADSGKASPSMPRPALPSPPREPKQAAGKPVIPPRRIGSLPPEPGKESSTTAETSSTGKAPPPLPPEEEVNTDKAPPPPLLEEETEEQVIDYASIYQALWDCKPDAEDELEFKRGDLIYIYEKPHSDWWIGSKYKPQGYETRLIPKNYLTEAYN